MNKFKRITIFPILLLLLIVGIVFSPIVPTIAASSERETSKLKYDTVSINLKQDIDSITVKYLERALNEAKEYGASTVILRLNTNGGELGSTLEIGELLHNSELNLISYVENKAMSAGTIIAMHTNTIYMQEGSTIGAAAIVDSSGELVDGPKENSSFRGKIVELAKVHNRDEQIALAMIDPYNEYDLTSQINIKKLKGDVLTLGAEDAVSTGYAKGVVTNYEALLTELEISADHVHEITTSYTERLAKFLTHPIVIVILLVLGIAGIVIELIFPGIGAPGIVGVVSLATFFFGSYIAGISEKETAFLFIVGVILIIIELFVPTFGILAILGGGAVITGILMASNTFESGLITLGVAIVIAIIIILIFSKTQKGKSMWSKLVLKEKLTAEAGYIPAELQDLLIGQEGFTLTGLRPSGTVLINDKRVDVITEGSFVEANRPVVVVKAEGTWVVVREIKS